MSKPNQNIIIIGGSLAGLLTGIPLKSLGHHVTILERTPTTLLHNQGAGIIFGSHAQEFFKKHVNPEINKEELSVKSEMRQTLDQNGEMLHEERVSIVPYRRQENEGETKYVVGRKVVGLRDLGKEGVEVECEVLTEDGKEDSKWHEGKKVTLRCDLVIAADGPSSTVRKIVCSEVERTYVGYVAWRGTVPENEASETMKRTFVDRFTFFHGFDKRTQILAYLIPGIAGNTEVGSRLVNLVWYCNYPADSEVYKDLMTDSDGHHHHFTLPVGKIQLRLVEQAKQYAAQVLSPQFAELVQSTRTPFVQAITDVLSPQAIFMDGKLLLVGDAVAGFRPHTASSTNQAAYQALLLEKVFEGGMEMGEAQDAIMQYAGHMSNAGKKMGNQTQFWKPGDQTGWSGASNLSSVKKYTN